MSLCNHCLEWAPRTRRELAIRNSNTPEKREKDQDPTRCPKCGGLDWLYTHARIEPHRYPRGWLARWYWRYWREAI